MVSLRLSIVLMLACVGIAGLGGCTGVLKDGDVIRVHAPNVASDRARQLTRDGVGMVERGDMKAAESAFKQAIHAQEGYGPAHNNLGRVYFQQGDLQRAAKAFHWAMEFMPGRAEPMNNLGMTLERGGRQAEAIELYQSAHALMPEEPEYLANLVKARMRRGDRGDDVRAELQTLKFIENRPEWKEWVDRRLVFERKAETKSNAASASSRSTTTFPSTIRESSSSSTVEQVGPDLTAPENVPLPEPISFESMDIAPVP